MSQPTAKIIETIVVTDNLNVRIYQTVKHGIECYIALYLNAFDEVVGQHQALSEYGIRNIVNDNLKNYR